MQHADPPTDETELYYATMLVDQTIIIVTSSNDSDPSGFAFPKVHKQHFTEHLYIVYFLDLIMYTYYADSPKSKKEGYI